MKRFKATVLFGIRWLRIVCRPDSGRGTNASGGFAAVDAVGDLVEI